MRITNRLLPLIGLVLTFSASALGQTGAIQGTVIDIDGTPLQGAKILMDRQEINQHFEIETDGDGKYFHAGLPSGTYKVTLEVDGQIVQWIDDLRVRSGPPAPADFDLESLAAAVADTEEAKALAAERARLEAARDAFNVGRAALDAENYDEAITQLKLAIAQDDTQHVIYANLADAYSATRQWEDAATNYRMALVLAPLEGAYYNNLGIVLGSAGKTEEAIAALEKTAELNPETASQAYYNLGAVMTNTGRTAAAVEAFKKAIEFGPENTEAYYQLGISYFGSTDTMKEAIPVLQKYLEMAPDSPNAEAARQLIAAAGGI